MKIYKNLTNNIVMMYHYVSTTLKVYKISNKTIK